MSYLFIFVSLLFPVAAIHQQVGQERVQSVLFVCSTILDVKRDSDIVLGLEIECCSMYLAHDSVGAEVIKILVIVTIF
jgi:hypothetical protein